MQARRLPWYAAMALVAPVLALGSWLLVSAVPGSALAHRADAAVRATAKPEHPGVTVTVGRTRYVCTVVKPKPYKARKPPVRD